MVDHFAPNQPGREGDPPSPAVANPATPGAVDTDPEMQAELETLAALLRSPVPGEEEKYLAESGCQRVLQLVAAIGRAPNEATANQVAAGDAERRAAPGATNEVFEPRDLGQYRLLVPLGAGGMGTVYKALHRKLDRVVALKVLPADKMQDAAAVARFEREMKAVGNLDHPNIVRAFDAGEVEGTHFLVMEYVEGMDLSTLARCLGPIPVADACKLIRQAALGLEHVHGHGLVHRDIKPSNLMLTRGPASFPPQQGGPDAATSAAKEMPDFLVGAGKVKLLDLGLALLDPLRVAEGSELTSSGQMMGTLDYMAPEQGSDSHAVDIRADIYSLGATLYRLLCGEAPFAGHSHDTPLRKMMALATERPVPVRERRPGVPDALAALVDRMLAKDPGDRFATPAEVAAAIEPFCGGTDLGALLSAADHVPVEAPADRRTATTEARLTSASHDTDPFTVQISTHSQSAGRRPTASWPFGPAPSAGGRRSRRRLMALALLPLAFLLGIVVWVNRTRIEAPDGSTVTVKSDGSVEVALPGQQPPETAGEPAGTATIAEPSPEPGEWIDLMPLVDLQRDVYAGTFEAAGQGFRCREGILRFPVLLCGDYELELTFRREQNEQIGILFPMLPDRSAAAVASRHRSAVLRLSCGEDAGLEVVDGKLLNELQPPFRVPSPVRDGVEHRASLRVRLRSADASIDAKVDDKPLVSWHGERKRLCYANFHYGSGFDPLPLPAPALRVGGFNGPGESVVISSARVRMLSGEAELGVRGGVVVGNPVRVEPAAIDIQPEAVAPEPGRPVCGIALVSRPAPLPGVQSWTVDTRGHRGAILDVEYSPDGKWLASAGRDGTIRVLDAKTEALARVLLGHIRPLKCLAWSPDGKYLASTGDDGALRYWDVAAGRLLRTVQLDDLHLNRLVWSPDGTTIAYTASGNQMGVWDVAGHSVRKAFDAPAGWAIAWSPDGKRLASTGNYNAVHIWDVGEAKVVASIPLDGKGGDIAWSPDGHAIAACFGDRLLFFDAGTGECLGRVIAEHPTSDPKFSPDDSLLACSTNQGCGIDLFETRSGKKRGHFSGRGIYMTSGHTAWSPDSEKLAIGAHGGCVHTTAPLRERQLRMALEGYCGSRYSGWWSGIPAWSPEGTEVVLAAQHGPTKLRVFNLADLDIPRRAARADNATSFAWSADGTRIIAVGNPSSVWSRDLTEQIAKIDGDFYPAWRTWPQRSPSGKLLAVANGWEGGKSEAAIFDLETNDVAMVKTREENRSIAWSPDETVLVLGKKDGRLVFYDVAAEKILEDVKRHESEVGHLAFSKDGRRLASAANDGTVRVYDAATRQPSASLTLDGPVTALTFSPDGSLLACGGEQGSWLLDTKSGQMVHQLEGRANALAFSDDGRQLLGIGIDGGRRRWDPATAERPADDVAHPTYCSSRKLKWSPDRRYVAAWADGLALHVWRTKDAQPMGAIGVLNDDVLYVSPEGHYRTSLDDRTGLVYIVLTESGEQQLLTPAEFETQYGWKNDPSKVQPLVDANP